MSPPARFPRLARRLLVVGAVLAVVAAAAGWWYAQRPAPAVRRLVLVVSGDTAGWIVPCGCTSNQSGGLPRRGTYVAGLRADADVIVADAGGAPGGTSPYQRVKFEAILRGEKAMGLDAHNVGGPEAALGADYLRRVAADLSAPFVSANLRAADGSLVAEPLRLVERGGRRVAVVGVLSRRFAAPGVQIDDPREAILREAAAAKGRYESLVVLAYAPEDELRQLAAGLPEADAVVGGPTGQSIAPHRLGPTVLASATNKGKFVVRLDAVGRGWDGRVTELDATHADDPGQRANVADYLAGLARQDFAAADSGFAHRLPADPPPDYRVAGTASCRKCHAADAAGWDATAHARAGPTLSAGGHHADPYCQQCHTTGYGLPGGFESWDRGAEARAVGCENCHGPSTGHARDPRVRTPFAARDQCVACHDRENSPRFDYGTYWAKVRHGETKGAGR